MDERKKLDIIYRIDDATDMIIKIFAVFLLLIGVYFTYDSAYVFYNSMATKVNIIRPGSDKEAEAVARDLTEDYVAWIQVDDTSLDYPIMQGEDNTEYLNKDAYGDYSLSGAIFLDASNSADFSDDYSLVYGHHMDGGFMFGCLDSWKNENYFLKHLEGSLYVGDKTYDLKIFAYADADAMDMEIFSPSEHYPLNYIRNHAVNYVEPDGEKIVVLSTCASATSTRRHIVAATISERAAGTTLSLSGD